jgi:hypothetical protein
MNGGQKYEMYECEAGRKEGRRCFARGNKTKR